MSRLKGRRKVAKISNPKGGVGNFFPGGGRTHKGGVDLSGGVDPPLHTMHNAIFGVFAFNLDKIYKFGDLFGKLLVNGKNGELFANFLRLI